ncbi:Aste57867_14570 [Aphanomyces stellatus]|uniref:Aste57867_14570 protein n=1 Tax=Aphanomyces stellatus TaxID=120398 RepID=A0A485L2P0_9STRA|nr:hypothetical protein As57867_014516 [Aphanomyces stellatus]VFT91390.1 Aste57867_14570 [Aphanomyces stellatus]
MRAQVHLQRGNDPAEVTPLFETTAVEPPHYLVGLSLVALSAVTASLVTTCVKYESVDLYAMETVFWRFVIAYVFTLILVLYAKVDLLVAPEHHWDLICRCLYGFGAIASLFWAITQMTLADASTLAFTSPILTFFFAAWLLHETIGLVELGCAFVSLVGVVFVVRPTIVFTAPILTYGSPYAPCVAVLSAVFTSLAFVHMRKLKSLHYIVVAHYFLLSGAAISGVYVLLAQGCFNLHTSGRSVTQAAIASGFMAFLGELALTKGLQIEQAGVASVVRYLDIVFVFIWDAALIRERISVWSLIGAVLIAAAVVALFVRKATARETV